MGGGCRLVRSEGPCPQEVKNMTMTLSAKYSLILPAFPREGHINIEQDFVIQSPSFQSHSRSILLNTKS